MSAPDSRYPVTVDPELPAGAVPVTIPEVPTGIDEDFVPEVPTGEGLTGGAGAAVGGGNVGSDGSVPVADTGSGSGDGVRSSCPG